MIFVDQIVITQSFGSATHPDGIRPLAGIRRISFREPGDISRDGDVQADTEVIGESQSAAWLHGSHETRIQIKSDGRTLLLAGNPGRFGRPENIWNLDLDGTVARANEIAESQGFPAGAFHKGDPVDFSRHAQLGSPLLVRRADEAHDQKYTGSRVWSMHLTQNYITGSPQNLKHVTNWIGTQSMRRVTKKRRGESTLEFGAIGYCQTQLYDKAAELLAHASKDERMFMQGTLKNEEDWFKEQKMSEAAILAMFAKRRAWRYAHENGLLRVEVKCAKDFLVHKGLTYLGAWDMGKVIEIFKERTELLERLEVEVDELDVERLPKSVRMDAAAWLAGVDLRTVLPQSTFYRKAKILGEYGLDVFQKRELATVRPIMKQIEIQPAAMPDWYRAAA